MQINIVIIVKKLEKEKWNKANILIVNHYLLAAHIAGDFKLLPDFSNLIIDEAHSFPDVLGKSFGLKASYEDISKLITKENNAVLMTDLAGTTHIITKHDLIQGISQMSN